MRRAFHEIAKSRVGEFLNLVAESLKIPDFETSRRIDPVHRESIGVAIVAAGIGQRTGQLRARSETMSFAMAGPDGIVRVAAAAGEPTWWMSST